ncbi:hypothetical protein CSB11_02275 [Candidatus Campbellbacteria bacterium]|nr:MAG: hypothetical protein CSB11_02275 [Candidatus Campbellbacteria bacterium]
MKVVEKISSSKNKTKKFIKKNNKKISILIFLGGFLFDFFTLTSIDTAYYRTIIFVYLSIALFFIFLINYGDYKNIKNKFIFSLYKNGTYVTQFAFGALLSGFVIFYTSSGIFAVSWPFLLLLYGLFVGNETFKRHYERFEFQIMIFYFILFAFSVFFIPITVGKMSDNVFIMSGLVSLFTILFIVKIFFKILPILKKRRYKILRNILIVFSIFNTFYFLNILPPIPLSVKSTQVAHLVERNVSGQRVLTVEKRSWYEFYDKYFDVFHKIKSGKVYFFVSIFAPRGFETEIQHVWEYYDDFKEKWVQKSKVKYNIIGGRNNGYRGYSYITNAEEGDWRVTIINKRGAVIGRKSFKVEDSDGDIVLEKKVLSN